jgi:hypothetical protein
MNKQELAGHIAGREEGREGGAVIIESRLLSNPEADFPKLDSLPASSWLYQNAIQSYAGAYPF